MTLTVKAGTDLLGLTKLCLPDLTVLALVVACVGSPGRLKVILCSCTNVCFSIGAADEGVLILRGFTEDIFLKFDSPSCPQRALCLSL